MDMFCPECMTPLHSSDGRTASCPAHSATFEILFTRHPTVAPAMRAAVMPPIPHPGAAPVAAPAYPLPEAYPVDPLVALGATDVLIDAPCVTHPQVAAVARCQSCRSPVCSTCLFVFPGGIQVCPKCAANPTPQVSPRRKKLIRWSIGLGIWSVLGLVGLIVAIPLLGKKADLEVLGVVIEVVSLLPAIVGLALGVGSFDRRLRTPGVVWIGVIGNGLVVVIWVLMMIVGAMK